LSKEGDCQEIVIGQFSFEQKKGTNFCISALASKRVNQKIKADYHANK
jgi:hypothetical protein